MPESAENQLTEEAVRKVAHLSRLAIEDEQVPRYTAELASVLEHIEGSSPWTWTGSTDGTPLPVHNRLGEDVPVEGLPVAALLDNAPAVEGDFIAVPKVLGEGS